MKKKFWYFTACISLALVFSQPIWAQSHTERLMVLPFENRLKDQSPAIADSALDSLQTHLFQIPQRPFQLIARRQVNLQLAELAFSETALSDPQKALQVGQMLSANLMLHGTIASGKIHTSEVTVHNPIKYTWATVNLHATLMRVETGEVLYATESSGRSARYPNWQGNTYTSLINEAVAQATHQLAQELTPSQKRRLSR